MNRHLIISALVICALSFFGPAVGRAMAAEPVSPSVLIKGGLVYDGSEAEPQVCDILVQGDRIVAVGNCNKWKRGERKAARKAQVIDAGGLVVAPGFIDPHSHINSDLVKAKYKNGEGYLTMGVTTVLCGVCGGSPVPLSQQAKTLEKQGTGLNVGYFIGLGSVRRKVLGTQQRVPTAEELEVMKSYVHEAMEWGAFGVSSGLIYTPGLFAKTDELIELTKVATPYRGIYTTHMRSEGENIDEALEEALTVGAAAGVDVNISHIKCAGEAVHGHSTAVIERIERAQAEGMHVTADQYAYGASSTSLKATVLPGWAAAQSREALNRMFDDPDTLEMIKKELDRNITYYENGETIIFPATSSVKELRGKSLAEAARMWNMTPVDAAVKLFRTGSPSVIKHSMAEEDIRNFMSREWTMTCTDGSIGGHPRSFGSFTRKIAKYVREDHLLTLGEAIRRCTGLVADTYGIADRGYIRKGAYADIVVFDADKVKDNATYTEPRLTSTGFRMVMVNGRVAVDNDTVTGELAGVIVKMDNSAKVR